MFIGNKTDTASNAFDGKIEELVFYNTVIYPVYVKSGTFTLDKPLKEFMDFIKELSLILSFLAKV